EILLKALCAPAPRKSARAWLYTLARNHCRNVRRGRARRREGAAPMGPIPEGPLTRLARDEGRARLADALASLPAAQRGAVALRYVDGLSRDEIAQVLGVSESIVKSRIHEGLEKLRAFRPPESR